MMEWIRNHWLECMVLFYLAGMMLYGHYRGFLKIAVSMSALLITLGVIRITLPAMTSFLRENTKIEQAIQSAMLERLPGYVGEEEEAPETERQDGAEETGQESLETMLASLPLSESLKRQIAKRNGEEMWNLLGVDDLAGYIAGYVSGIIFNLLGFVVLFVAIWLLMHILLQVLDIFSKLPVIHGTNQLAGAVVGLLYALLVLWVAALVLSAVSGTVIGRILLSQVRNSLFLFFLFDYNLLSVLLSKVILAI